jgi:taurine dioxygenase
MSEPISHRPLSPFGVEVLGVDLSKDLSPTQVAGLQALYDEHHLLLFRGQNISHDRQVEVVGNFGPPLLTTQDGKGYISNEPGKGGLGDSELAYHSDLAFTPEPFLGISLHAVNVANGRSATRFVNSCRAFSKLPADRQDKLRGLHAMHVFSVDMTGRNGEDVPDDLPRAVHPLVMPHPRTGEEILYINLNQTARIVELPADESAALIEDLFASTYDPADIYEHRWDMGDFILWDNLALQHARAKITENVPRTLQRVVLARKGFFEQCPQFSREQFMTAGVM